MSNPTIVYKSANAELWCGDCLDVLPTLPQVDLICVDPPYFRVKDEPWDKQWDTAQGFLDWIGQLCGLWLPLLKPNGSLYCFASPQMSARVECKIAETFNVLNNIRWIKEDGWHKKAEKESLRSYLSNWESVIFAEHSGCQYQEAATALHKDVYAPIGRRVGEIREAAGLGRGDVDTACCPSRKPTGLCYRWEAGDCLPTLEQWVDLLRLCGDRREYEDLRREYEDLRREYEDLRREYEDLRRPFSLTAKDQYTDTWHFLPVMGYEGKHPCEKPHTLLKHILTTSTRPGATVLDCCMGTGSLGLACLAEGRGFVGVDASEAYCKIAKRRIIEAEQQLRLSY